MFFKFFRSLSSSKKSVSNHAPLQKAYFSPGNDCLNVIVETLNVAQLTVDICVFTISDDRISRAVFGCHKRGVKVRVITDDDKSLDMGSDVSDFAKKGIKVKTDKTEAHMHHKFAIIDNRILINGSYNWTRSAAEYNEENLVVSHDLGLTAAFSAIFEVLWKKSVLLRV